MRRAYSVCDQPMTPEGEEEESEYEESPSMAGATHAEYARRHGTKYVPRVDGSPGFKPMRCSIAATGEGVTSPVANRKKVSPYGPGGLPGFGDNEMDGKILPCHKVKEDGLVRITSDTVSVPTESGGASLIDFPAGRADSGQIPISHQALSHT